MGEQYTLLTKHILLDTQKSKLSTVAVDEKKLKMPTALKLSVLYFAQLQTRAMPSELNGSAYQYKRERPSKRSGSSSAPGESKDILQHSRKNKDKATKTHWRFPVQPDKGYEQDDFCYQLKQPKHRAPAERLCLLNLL